MALGDEKYLAFTTFRADGEPAVTRVRVVPVSDGRIGFWCAMGDGETDRLRTDPRVTVQPSDARGRVKEGTNQVTGTADLVRSGELFDEVQAKVRQKYGVMVAISRAAGRVLGHRRKGETYVDTVVLVRLEG